MLDGDLILPPILLFGFGADDNLRVCHDCVPGHKWGVVNRD